MKKNAKIYDALITRFTVCLERWFVWKIFGYYPQKSKLKILYRNFSLSRKEVSRKLPRSKRQAGWVQAKSLLLTDLLLLPDNTN